MPIKPDFFDSIAKEIAGKLNRVSYLLSGANLKSGEYHEEIIRVTLSNFLSKRYSVKTGYIFLDDGIHSGQLDIIIVDENYPTAYIFQEKDFVIVRPEAVVAVIEVKTRFGKRELIDGFERIFEVKKIKKDALEYYGQIYGLIFAFDSKSTLNDSLVGSWFSDPQMNLYKNEVGALWPDSIFVFNQGYLLHRDANHNWDKESGLEHYYKIYREPHRNDSSWQLSLIILTILAMCEGSHSSQLGIIPSIKSTKMADFSEAHWSEERFAPGEGSSKR